MVHVTTVTFCQTSRMEKVCSSQLLVTKPVGQFSGRVWSEYEFERPTLSKDLPAVIKPDPFVAAQREISRALLKVDHFQAIYKLEKEIDGMQQCVY